jgi:hypothetical protein
MHMRSSLLLRGSPSNPERQLNNSANVPLRQNPADLRRIEAAAVV